MTDNAVDVFFLVLFIALLGVGIWKFYAAGSVGSLWQRVLAAGRNSATIVWNWLVALVGVGISALAEVANLLNEPELAAAIPVYLPPKTVSAIMLTVAFITVVARRRHGSTDPV